MFQYETTAKIQLSLMSERAAAEPTQRGVSFANVTLAAAPLPPLRVAKRRSRLALPVYGHLLLQWSQYIAVR